VQAVSEKEEGVMDAIIKYAEDIKAKEKAKREEEEKEKEKEKQEEEARQAEIPQSEIMESDGPVTWRRQELFAGAGDWGRCITAVLIHPFQLKLYLVIAFGSMMIHYTAMFVLAFERDSVYATAGESVRFDYQRVILELPGYDVILKRRDLSQNRKTMAEVVREERERELERQEFLLQRKEYEKQTLRLSELPDAPGADILGELGMSGPGH
jgi:hypothetical protein